MRGAGELERWLLERVISDAMDDMGAYIRDAVEEQAEEEAWLDDVAPGRRDTRGAGCGGGASRAGDGGGDGGSNAGQDDVAAASGLAGD